jgi:hypothetical protein
VASLYCQSAVTKKDYYLHSKTSVGTYFWTEGALESRQRKYICIVHSYTYHKEYLDGEELIIARAVDLYGSLLVNASVSDWVSHLF